MSYSVGTGHDSVGEGLTELDPQPDEAHMGGVGYTQVVRTLNGSIDAQGKYFRFVWSMISATDYATLLTTFGLSTSALYANVTINVSAEDMATATNYNGVAQLPLPGDTAAWNIRPVNVEILVTDLEEIV